MADRRPSDAGLERALSDLGGRVAYPPTPALAGAVRARIETGGRPYMSWAAPGRRAAAALAVALLLAAALVLGISAGARDAVADLLGLPGVRFFSTPEPPAAPTTPDGAGSASPIFGSARVSLEDAQRMVSFTVRVPSLRDLSRPDEVHAGDSPPGGAVTLIYYARPGLPEASLGGVGLLITQFRGDYEPYVRKGLPPGTRLEELSVGGVRGYWVEGAPHILIFRDDAGAIREERSRLAGNTLLWERDGVTFRLESALGREEAVRIAVSLR